VDVGCSIGVTIIDHTSISPSEKLAQADVACHLAKRAGRNRVHMFSNKDAGDVQTMSIDMGWSRRIRQALENDRFVLAVQPIYKISSREISSYEILVRMRDDDNSIIMPSGFLPTADRFGLSSDIDAWVFEHAIKQMAQFNEQGINIHFAINLSGQSITTPKIATLIPQIIKDTGIDPAALTFEVTETTAISNIDIAINLLTKLRDMGCKTALDDFGSGMSSFAYLQELPVDIVKIDGRFVRNITNSSVDQAMVRAMNDIAHALDKQTVAEFVENEHHLKMLSVIGVDFAQGYHLGKPKLITEVSSQLVAELGKSSKLA
jgi:EAL domain-containing protein (putative c-di-GMP-specific phosphodiesterase class I)